MFSIIDREAMEREEAELKAAQAAKEAEKKATAATIPSSRVMPPTPPSSRWDGTDTLRTPTTDTVASEPAPKESKSLQSWFFTEEAEPDRFAEPEPPPSAKSESFFSGWTIFETLFSSRTNTEDKATTTTGFFSGPIPRRTGWLFIDMFLSEKTDTVARQPGFSLPTKFLLLAVPLLAVAGYYQYASVSGATILGKTLSNSVNLERGLVGHWTFDGGDMSTTTAFDVSGNQNNMNILNNKIVIGKIGQAIKATPNTYVSPSASLNDMSQVTAVLWIKPQQFQDFFRQDNPIISKGNQTADQGWRLVASSTSGIVGFVSERATSDGYWRTNTNSFRNGEWVFMAVSYDKSSTVNDPLIYINGVAMPLTEVSTPSGSQGTDTTRSLRILYDEVYLYLSNPPVEVDDVRIYNRILTAKEIERLYKMGEGVKINTNTIPSGSTLEDGLVGYWSFNGADFTDKVYDRSGQNNHGYLVGMATTSAKVPGKVGQGLSFDGVDDKVTLGNSVSASINSNLTICLWANIREWSPVATDQEKLVQAGVDQDTSNFIFNFDNALRDTNTHRDLAFQSESASKVVYSGTGSIIDLNEWNHLCVTHTNTGPSTVIYVNGSLVPTTGTTGLLSGDSVATTIGSREGGAAGEDKTNGTLDEVRIYNRVLSADEVAQLYESGGGSTMGMCGQGPVLDADGNKYGIVQIGTQCWLDRNMNVGTRISGATTQTDNATIEKWCYNNTDSNCNDNHSKRPDGGLYQWNEAMQYSTSPGAQGICPVGWHIPTDAEWYTLENFLKDNGQSCISSRSNAFGCSPAGTELVLGRKYGFNANLGGYGSFGSFTFRDTAATFWSSTESLNDAFYRGLLTGNAQILRNTISKVYGYSVRCLKD